MKLPFTSHRTKQQIEATNLMLENGKKLEKNGDLLGAFMLYSGLFAADQECLACRSHMARVATQLEHSGKKVVVVDEGNKENTIVLTGAKL